MPRQISFLLQPLIYILICCQKVEEKKLSIIKRLSEIKCEQPLMSLKVVQEGEGEGCLLRLEKHEARGSSPGSRKYAALLQRNTRKYAVLIKGITLPC